LRAGERGHREGSASPPSRQRTSSEHWYREDAAQTGARRGGADARLVRASPWDPSVYRDRSDLWDQSVSCETGRPSTRGGIGPGRELLARGTGSPRGRGAGSKPGGSPGETGHGGGSRVGNVALPTAGCGQCGITYSGVWAMRHCLHPGLGRPGLLGRRSTGVTPWPTGSFAAGGRPISGKGNFPCLRGLEAEWEKGCPGRRLVIEQAIQL
jgi:hypothetical protein